MLLLLVAVDDDDEFVISFEFEFLPARFDLPFLFDAGLDDDMGEEQMLDSFEDGNDSLFSSSFLPLSKPLTDLPLPLVVVLLLLLTVAASKLLRSVEVVEMAAPAADGLEVESNSKSNSFNLNVS